VDGAVAALVGSFNVGQAAQSLGIHLGRHLTGVYNAKTGASQASAISADIIAAEAAAAAAAAMQAQQTAAINSQLPHFYGGSGASGNSFSLPLTAYTPAGFTSIGGGLEIYNVGTAATDQQTVSALWNNVLAAGESRSLVIRSNAAGTTYCVATITLTGSTNAFYYNGNGLWANLADANAAFTIEIACYVAGVKTSFQTWSYPIWQFAGNYQGNAYYSLSTGYYSYYSVSANRVFAFEATANVFTFSFNQQTWTYTDSSNISQIGSAYRSGGYSDTTSSLSTQISWDFYDSGPTSGPGTAYVATAESTTSATFTDLATTTDQITVNIGASGMALVLLSVSATNNGNNYSYTAFAMSGANTLAASTSYGVQYAPSAVNVLQAYGCPFLLTGLTQGATTFKMKYAVGGGTGTFQFRRISVIPL